MIVEALYSDMIRRFLAHDASRPAAVSSIFLSKITDFEISLVCDCDCDCDDNKDNRRVVNALYKYEYYTK